LALPQWRQRCRSDDGHRLLQGREGEGEPFAQCRGVLRRVTQDGRGAVAHPLQTPGAHQGAAQRLREDRLEQQRLVAQTGMRE